MLKPMAPSLASTGLRNFFSYHVKLMMSDRSRERTCYGSRVAFSLGHCLRPGVMTMSCRSRAVLIAAAPFYQLDLLLAAPSIGAGAPVRQPGCVLQISPDRKDRRLDSGGTALSQLHMASTGRPTPLPCLRPSVRSVGAGWFRPVEFRAGVLVRWAAWYSLRLLIYPSSSSLAAASRVRGRLCGASLLSASESPVRGRQVAKCAQVGPCRSARKRCARRLCQRLTAPVQFDGDIALEERSPANCFTLGHTTVRVDVGKNAFEDRELFPMLACCLD